MDTPKDELRKLAVGADETPQQSPRLNRTTMPTRRRDQARSGERLLHKFGHTCVSTMQVVYANARVATSNEKCNEVVPQPGAGCCARIRIGFAAGERALAAM